MSDLADLLRVEDLTFAYGAGDAPVLRGVSFGAGTGHFICIAGPNGSGKTTLLRCLLRFLSPAGGRIEIDGRDVRDLPIGELARTIAYVPQFPVAAFAFAVRDVVLMGRYAHAGLLGLAGEQDLAIAREAMRMTGTLAFEARDLDSLSGGEAQCVMIARALAQQPRVMILDEPTSHLDLRNQLQMYQLMRRVAHDWPMTVLCVSHDLNLAGRYADRLILLREGRILADGSPPAVLTSEIVGAAYGVPVRIIEDGGDRFIVPLS